MTHVKRREDWRREKKRVYMKNNAKLYHKNNLKEKNENKIHTKTVFTNNHSIHSLITVH